jgi:hypothetical protein
MHIGYIGGCERLLRKMNGIILTKDQSWQHKKWREDPNIWTEKPNIKTAADLDWLEPLLLTKTGASSIVIEQDGNEFFICKNINFHRTRTYKGNIEDLFDVITYWHNKKRKYHERKKWRDIEGVGHIYI